jgi:hypothetical protein
MATAKKRAGEAIHSREKETQDSNNTMVSPYGSKSLEMTISQGI